jgi:hypothetical protein
LEAHIEALTQQNRELLLRNMGQPHPKMNLDECEEEERNSHVNGQDDWEEDRWVDDHQEDNFRRIDPREFRNRRLNRYGDQREGDLSKIITEWIEDARIWRWKGRTKASP